MWTGFFWLRIGSSGGLCEYGSKYSVSTKCGEYLDELSYYELLKEDTTLWN
jgi:hypothetical protein